MSLSIPPSQRAFPIGNDVILQGTRGSIRQRALIGCTQACDLRHHDDARFDRDFAPLRRYARFSFSSSGVENNGANARTRRRESNNVVRTGREVWAEKRSGAWLSSIVFYVWGLVIGRLPLYIVHWTGPPHQTASNVGFG